MGCKQDKVVPVPQPVDEPTRNPTNRSIATDLVPIDRDAFSPSVRQQRQTAIENSSYRIAIGKWRPASVKELAGSIEQLSAGKSQIDRAWIIFYWISQNIAYDTEALFNDRIGTQDVDTILASKRAVCEGYAALFADLCSRVEIPCVKVSGFAKGFGFDVRQTDIKQPDHAWNIITLENGHSYFVEPTWGSGHLDSATNKFKANLTPYYFMCTPEQMIYGHLPDDSKHQLLARPITPEQYLMLPHTYPAYFTHGLQIVSPVRSCKVELVDDHSYGQVVIRAVDGAIQLTGALQDEAGNTIEGADYPRMHKTDPTLWLCDFAPPKPGRYDIVIFVQRGDAAEFAPAIAVHFGFDVAQLPTPPVSYPVLYPHFFDLQLHIVKPANTRFAHWSPHANQPFDEILIHAPENARVLLKLKDIADNAYVKDSTLTNFNHDAQLWQCLFAPAKSNTPYEISILARNADVNESYCAAKLDLRPIAQQDLKQTMVFPETYPLFVDHKCQLFEPLTGVLRSGSSVRFRCRVPGAQEINISSNGTWAFQTGQKPDANGVFECNVTVGQNDVSVWMKPHPNNKFFDSLLKYSVT